MASRKSITAKVCMQCGGEFIPRRSTQRFCSPVCGNLARSIPVAERFEQHIGPVTESGCILWTGPTDPDGYGSFKVTIDNKRKHVRAHRVAYERVNGPIPCGQCVCHKCDTPLCINPEHMFLGTDTDNMADKTSKGRQARGASVGLAKMTEELVVELRRRYAMGGISILDLAREFGITQNPAWMAIKRKTWKHIP
jgi:hypothetical protein